jgi:hypothetical protein
MFGGDVFNATNNVEGYLRTFQFTQTVYIDGEDLIGDGDVNDLPYLTQIFNEVFLDV